MNRTMTKGRCCCCWSFSLNRQGQKDPYCRLITCTAWGHVCLTHSSVKCIPCVARCFIKFDMCPTFRINVFRHLFGVNTATSLNSRPEAFLTLSQCSYSWSAGEMTADFVSNLTDILFFYSDSHNAVGLIFDHSFKPPK